MYGSTLYVSSDVTIMLISIRHIGFMYIVE
jgi:hypothetical protein